MQIAVISPAHAQHLAAYFIKYGVHFCSFAGAQSPSVGFFAGLPAPIPERETAVLQPVVEQFPGQDIRENISENRECFAHNREIHLQNRVSVHFSHTCFFDVRTRSVLT
jgi:hypothetical protein